MTCTLCNADLPKGEPVQRRTLRLKDSTALDASLCKACVYAHDAIKRRAETATFVLLVIVGILFYAVCCAG